MPPSLRLIFPAIFLALCALAAADAAAQQGPSLNLLDSVRQALEHNQAIQVSARQVSIAQGQRQQAGGGFDTVVYSSLQKQRMIAAPSPNDDFYVNDDGSGTANINSGSVGLSQMLRNGVTISPQATQSRVDAVPVAGIPLSRLTTLSLNVTIPLMKNVGAHVLAANEQAAGKEVEAARLDLAQTVSNTTLNVVSAYWAYLAADQALTVARDAEAGAARRVDDTAQLVRAQVLPAAERDLVGADEISKRAVRIAAEQTLAEARGALARLMGLSAADARALAPPGDAFPAVLTGDPVRRLALIQQQALDQRPDLRASQLRYEAAEIGLSAARKNLKPQLDLVLGVGTSSVRETSADIGLPPVTLNRRGPNASVMLNYQFALQNNGAGGQLVQRQGVLDQLDIGLRDLRATVLTNTETLAYAVQRLGQQLTEAGNAVTLYERAVANEEIRHKLGQGSAMDVLNITDRLLQARQNLTSAQLRYAVAIAQLRHASGSLMRPNAQADLVVERASLVTAP